MIKVERVENGGGSRGKRKQINKSSRGSRSGKSRYERKWGQKGEVMGGHGGVYRSGGS